MCLIRVHCNPPKCVRNLGVLFDENLSLVNHVKNICKKASFGLYKLGKIRQYLDKSTTERLVHAFVLSHIDNCNSILFGLPEVLLSKVQHIQNSAARLITRTKRCESISPVLYNLHWLPVNKRIMFKILVITFKCIHGNSPDYIQELISLYKSSRVLRSSSKNLLVQYSVKTKTYGQRSFQFAAPMLWNKLPYHIRQSDTEHQFRANLKAFLFVNEL